MRVADVQLTFPAILIALLVNGIAKSVFGNRLDAMSMLIVLVVAIGLSFWVQYARTVRGSVLVEKNKDYVAAAQLIGLPAPVIMLRHVLPNAMGPVLVIATLNLNGDYVSDALAAQVGGIGISPGGNIGDGPAVFEATHGTAPGFAGKDRVNPSSLILSAEMMLRYLDWADAADLIIKGVARTIANKELTYDLARLREAISSSASTTAVAMAAHNTWAGTSGAKATPRFTSVLLLPQPLKQRRHVHLVGLVVAGQRVHHDVHPGAEGEFALARLAFDHRQRRLSVRLNRPGAREVVGGDDDRRYAVAAARRAAFAFVLIGGRRQRLYPELA